MVYSSRLDLLDSLQMPSNKTWILYDLLIFCQRWLPQLEYDQVGICLQFSGWDSLPSRPRLQFMALFQKLHFKQTMRRTLQVTSFRGWCKCSRKISVTGRESKHQVSFSPGLKLKVTTKMGRLDDLPTYKYYSGSTKHPWNKLASKSSKGLQSIFCESSGTSNVKIT